MGIYVIDNEVYVLSGKTDKIINSYFKERVSADIPKGVLTDFFNSERLMSRLADRNPNLIIEALDMLKDAKELSDLITK